MPKTITQPETRRSFTVRELRALDTATGKKFRGYAALFNVIADLGDFDEMIEPGAFAESIGKDDIRALLNHDPNVVLGRNRSGTLTLAEDSKGLAIEIVPPDTQAARDLAELVSRGDVNQMSFGFFVQQERETYENGRRLRIIEKASLFDVSIVTFPAYEETTVNYRGKNTMPNLNTMSTEELTAEHNRLYGELQNVRDNRSITDAEREVRTRELNAQIVDVVGNLPRGDGLSARPGDLGNEYRDKGNDRENRITASVPHFRSPDTYRFQEKDASLRGSFNRYLRSGAHALSDREYRALQADVDTAGGYMVMPEILANQVLIELDNYVFVRKLAQKLQVPNAASLGVPAVDADFGDPTWTSELSTGDEDSDMTLGKRSLTPHPLARRIKVSNKLLRLSTLNPEALVLGRMVTKIGTCQEAGYMTGSGAGEPLGIFTASELGISTGRDVSEGNTETAIKFDGLMNAVGAMKEQYLRGAVWVFSRAAMTQIRKTKDGDSNYVLQPSVAGAFPNTLFGLPVITSEYAPSTFTTGKYVGCLANFGAGYMVADSLQMEVKRLDELYAETNQTGFICRYEGDGMPVDENAFVRVKLA